MGSLLLGACLTTRTAAADEPWDAAPSRDGEPTRTVPRRARLETRLVSEVRELPRRPHGADGPDGPARAGVKRAGVTFTPARRDTGGATPRKVLAFVVGGIGIGGLGLGATAGLLALQRNTPDRQCNDTLRMCSAENRGTTSHGGSLVHVSQIGWAVGALGIGTGVYLLVTTRKPAGGADTAIGPDLYAGGAGLHVTRRWW